MIKVNLLPYREKKKEVQSKNQVVILGALGVAFAVLLLGFHIFTVMKLNDLENTSRARSRGSSSSSRASATSTSTRKRKRFWKNGSTSSATSRRTGSPRSPFWMS